MGGRPAQTLLRLARQYWRGRGMLGQTRAAFAGSSPRLPPAAHKRPGTIPQFK